MFVFFSEMLICLVYFFEFFMSGFCPRSIRQEFKCNQLGHNPNWRVVMFNYVCMHVSVPNMENRRWLQKRSGIVQSKGPQKRSGMLLKHTPDRDAYW